MKMWIKLIFVCGCEKTGPWDFVQDIATYPSMDFPSKIVGDVEEIGGVELGSLMNEFIVEESDESFKVIKLSTNTMRLTHSLAVVNEEYPISNLERCLLFYVAYGKGDLKTGDRKISLREWDIFAVLPEIYYRIKAEDRIILHRFEWI